MVDRFDGEIGHHDTQSQPLKAPLVMLLTKTLIDLGHEVCVVAEIRRAQFVPYWFMSGNIAPLRASRPGATTPRKPFNEAELNPVIQQASWEIPA